MSLKELIEFRSVIADDVNRLASELADKHYAAVETDLKPRLRHPPPPTDPV